VPRHLHFETPSPHIRWHDLAVRVPVATEEWKPGITGRRIAGVSSFGFSGTNCHLVLEEAPAQPNCESPYVRPVHLLTVSARNEAGLRDQCRRYADWIENHDQDPGDLCYSATVGRTHFPHRVAIVGRDREELANRVRVWERDGRSPGVRSGRAAGGEKR